jgi:pimeloyl-ACP methyl ester carboxylesterase
MWFEDLAAEWGLRARLAKGPTDPPSWIAAAERRYPPRGDFVSVNGVGLHYLDRGRGRPVVFLHGAALLADELFCGPAGDALAADYRVIAFDRPGFGHSGRDDQVVGPAAQARLIHGALARIGVERPILVGHSWSGALVLHYGLAYPADVAGIVSLAGWCFATHQASIRLLSLVSQNAVETVMATGIGPKLARQIVVKARERVFAPDPVPSGFAELPIDLMIRPSQLRANADDMHALNQDVLRIQRQYRRFRVPLEVLVGSEDRLVEPARHGIRLAAIVPGARLTEVPGAGHMLHHARPEALAAAIARLCV